MIYKYTLFLLCRESIKSDDLRVKGHICIYLFFAPKTGLKDITDIILRFLLR